MGALDGTVLHEQTLHSGKEAEVGWMEDEKRVSIWSQHQKNGEQRWG